uniref:Uncharacterized protein n=1 Tax=Anguilla anguilla TaxID=7936 RepID=A0A0E9U7Y2_ANGAN
MASSSHMCGE